MTETALTPQQQQAIDSICSGGAISGAIAAVNVPFKKFPAGAASFPISPPPWSKLSPSAS